MFRLALISVIFLASAFRLVAPHEHHGEESGGSCEMSPEARLIAEYVPGVVTIDGHADEWAEVDGSEFDLLPALDPDEDKAYGGGKMTVKVYKCKKRKPTGGVLELVSNHMALHDGNNVFFMLKVDGEYAYSKGENGKCPSVALMFQVGENASYLNMGGCKDMPGTCTRKSCRGHEVDILHFSIGNAIPGRLYGGNSLDNGDGNGGDRFGHLVDVYAWNPHCRYLDGMGPSGNSSNAQNDWHGAWWHDSLDVHSGFTEDDSPYAEGGKKGTYYFEFTRPLRTMDRFQQDVQFVIGQASKIAVAFWYPVDGKPWHGSQHYSASCDWLPLDITTPTGGSYQLASRSSWDAASAFALLMSVVSFCVSIFIGYWVSKNKSVPFTPIDHL